MIPGTSGIKWTSVGEMSAECERIGITRVADITGLDIVGIPVAQAVRPMSKSLSVSQGKGFTLQQAKLTAFGEAYELYCAENIFFQSRREDGSNKIVAHGLFDGAEHALELEQVSMDLTAPETPEAQLKGRGATGLAAHPNVNRAVRHGVLECLERHLYSVWYRAQPGRHLFSLIRLESIRDAYCRSVIDRLQEIGLNILVWNLGPGLNIYSFLVEIFETRQIPGNLVAYSQGLACDCNTDLALRKALLEGVQTRLAYISGAREDLTTFDFFGRLRDVADNRSRFSAKHQQVIHQQGDTRNEKRDIERIKDSIVVLELDDPVVVDLTPPGWPIKAVKVQIPRALDDLGEESIS